MTSSDDLDRPITIADLDFLTGSATESRRRFQDWTSGAAIAVIGLSAALVGSAGLNKNYLGIALGFLLAVVIISAVDRMIELFYLLRASKHALENVGKAPTLGRSEAWVRKARYWAFFLHVALLPVGLLFMVIAILSVKEAGP